MEAVPGWQAVASQTIRGRASCRGWAETGMSLCLGALAGMYSHSHHLRCMQELGRVGMRL